MLNRVILIGRLTREAEIRYTASQVPYARFTIAADRPYNSQRNESNNTDFISCIAWQKTAEIIQKYTTKGSLVAIEGRIETGSYEKDGKKVYTTDVRVDNLRLLDRKNKSDDMTSGPSPVDFENKNDSINESDPFADFGNAIEVTDDDLPF